MIRVLIVSDIRLYREGLAQVVDRGTLHVAGAFATVADALGQLSEQPPDVVLLDMANPNALAGIRSARARLPSAKIVALGVARHDGDLIACAEAGIAGYIFRDASLDELMATVESAARGELRCSPDVAATLLRRIARLSGDSSTSFESRLTRREREIVSLVDQGLTNKEIAARLYIEIATVKNHIHNILEKLGVRTRAEAAATLRRARRGVERVPSADDANVE
jgi:DNA-binding NarL/FixJ family response regulator